MFSFSKVMDFAIGIAILWLIVSLFSSVFSIFSTVKGWITSVWEWVSWPFRSDKKQGEGS